jgi:hypothetical protein
MSLEGVDSIYTNTYFHEDNFTLSIATQGHSMTVYSISPANLKKIADVINRAIATNKDTSSIDYIIEGVEA